ncbi:MAG: hypothetical protein JO078_04065 [Candidatus Eremiobacteraeota bacterium]|nr:hypothetical protein [Candidatus Eremiobacteraeota bacterium]
MIEHVRGRFSRTRVNLDNQRFESCVFENCVVVFSGTGSYGLRDCSFKDCSFALEGPAASALQFMTDFYRIAPQMIEGMFDKIRRDK